jgi:hypothetical protein
VVTLEGLGHVHKEECHKNSYLHTHSHTWSLQIITYLDRQIDKNQDADIDRYYICSRHLG